ncbi:hypothetical protein Prudu_014934, partial [Prunus dulcis]
HCNIMAAELTSGHALTTASCQDELLAKTSKIKKSLRKIWAMEKSLRELGENEKYLAALLAQKIQLIDLKKLISKQLRLLRPSRADSQKHGLPMVENASTMINQGEDRSLFLMVTFLRGKYTDAIYEVKFKFGGEVDDMGAQVARVAKFSGSTHLGARLFDRSQLYVFSEEGWDKPCVDSFGGYIFDTKTRALDRLTPSTVQFKQHGKLCRHMAHFIFLKPKQNSYKVQAYSLGNTTLIRRIGCKCLRFHFLITLLCGKNWKQVEIGTCTPFQGRAVVVGETIYALNRLKEDEIIAYSLRRKVVDDGDIAYSLVRQFKLNGLDIADPPLQFDGPVTDYLVHLGNQDFVHVKTGTNEECDEGEVQHLCVTTFQIVQGMIETLHSTVLRVKIDVRNWFMLTLGFTPECGDYEPEESKSAASLKQPKQEDDTTLDENSLMHEEEAKHEVAFMHHEKANQTKPKNASGIIKNKRKRKSGWKEGLHVTKKKKVGLQKPSAYTIEEVRNQLQQRLKKEEN